MNCPRDNVAMELQGYWKHPRHKCEKCEGIPLFESLCTDPDFQRLTGS